MLIWILWRKKHLLLYREVIIAFDLAVRYRLLDYAEIAIIIYNLYIMIRYPNETVLAIPCGIV